MNEINVSSCKSQHLEYLTICGQMGTLGSVFGRPTSDYEFILMQKDKYFLLVNIVRY